MKYKYLNSMVGQSQFKSEMEFRLDGFSNTDYLAHTLIAAPRGSGKSLAAQMIAAELTKITEKKYGIKKGFIQINSADIKTCDGFFTHVFPLITQNQHVTLFFDESHNIGPAFTSALLTILNPNDTHKTQYFLPDGTKYDFDFHHITVIMASTAVQLMHPDLVDRLRRVELDEYDITDIASIIVSKTKDISYDDDVLIEIASTIRGNARKAIDRASDIQSMGVDHVGPKEWKKLRKALTILPLGVSKLEYQYLRELRRGPATLTEIASRLSISNDMVQKDIEIYLRKIGAFKTQSARGRVITKIGLDILDEIEALYK